MITHRHENDEIEGYDVIRGKSWKVTQEFSSNNFETQDENRKAMADI
jgi:hypothetical protein